MDIYIYIDMKNKYSITISADNAGELSSINRIKHNTDDLLLNLCEELELLSREYSNEVGEGSLVACGSMLDVETEHPDCLIKQGIEQSDL